MKALTALIATSPLILRLTIAGLLVAFLGSQANAQERYCQLEGTNIPVYLKLSKNPQVRVKGLTCENVYAHEYMQTYKPSGTLQYKDLDDSKAVRCGWVTNEIWDETVSDWFPPRTPNRCAKTYEWTLYVTNSPPAIPQEVRRYNMETCRVVEYHSVGDRLHASFRKVDENGRTSVCRLCGRWDWTQWNITDGKYREVGAAFERALHSGMEVQAQCERGEDITGVITVLPIRQ